MLVIVGKGLFGGAMFRSHCHSFRLHFHLIQLAQLLLRENARKLTLIDSTFHNGLVSTIIILICVGQRLESVLVLDIDLVVV